MTRTNFHFILSLGLTSLGLGLAASCGSDNSAPDAPVVVVPDAPVDAAIDALVCTAPKSTACASECVDTTNDVDHCGQCDMACTGGRTCVTSACTCPGNFIPATIAPSAQDRILTNSGVRLATAPVFGSGGIHIVSVGFPIAGIALNQDIAIDATTLGTPPFVLAGYKLDLTSQIPSADAAYYTTAGTLNFTKACEQGASGTLTNATFSGVVSLTDLTIDPNGCTFTVASMPFSIGQPGMCPGT